MHLPANFDSLTPSQRLALAERERLKGNEAFKALDFEEAAAAYSRAIAADSTSSNAALAFSNRAQARLKLSNWEGAEEDAGAALAIDPENPKSFLRRGAARVKRGRYAAACADFEKILSSNMPGADALLLDARRQLKEASALLAKQRKEGGQDPEPSPASSKAAPASEPARRRVAIEAADDDEEDDAPAASLGSRRNGILLPSRQPADEPVAIAPVRSRKIQIVEGGDSDWSDLSGDEAERKPAIEKGPQAAARLAPAAEPPASAPAPISAPSTSAPAPISAPSIPAPPAASAQAEAVRLRGNEFFKKGEYASAAAVYQEAANLDPATSGVARTNRAAALLKLGEPREAAAEASAALAVLGVSDALVSAVTANNASEATKAAFAAAASGEPSNVLKALYRRALARKECEEYAGAASDLAAAAEIEPANKDVHNELKTVKALARAAAQAEAAKSPQKEAPAAAPRVSPHPTISEARSLPSTAATPSPVSKAPPPGHAAASAARASANAAAELASRAAALAARTISSPTSSPGAAAAAASSRVAALPAAPRSATDVTLATEQLRRKPEVLFKWLRSTTTGPGIASLFKTAPLEVEVLGRIALALGEGTKSGLSAPEDCDWAAGVVNGLAAARGIRTSASMLADEERAAIVVALDAISAGGRDVAAARAAFS